MEISHNDILLLFEDCTVSIPAYKLYKTIGDDNEQKLLELLKNGLLVITNNNSVSLSALAYSNRSSSDSTKLNLVGLQEKDILDIFTRVDYSLLNLVKDIYGHEAIDLINTSEKFRIFKRKLSTEKPTYRLKDTFNIYGEYNLLIVPNNEAKEFEFVCLADDFKADFTSDDYKKERPIKYIENTNNKIADGSRELSDLIVRIDKQKPLMYLVFGALIILVIILIIINGGD